MKLTNVLKYNNVPDASKVFFVPVNTYSVDFCDAFAQNGFEVYSLNFGGPGWNHEKYMKEFKHAIEQMFLKTCSDIQPTLVFLMLDVPLISPKILLECKNLSPNTIFVNWTGDVRPQPKRGVIEVGKAIDITFIVSTGQIEAHKECGLKRVEFLQAGVKPCFFPLKENERKALRKELQHDVVFCANNSSNFPGYKLRNDVAVKVSKLLGNRFGLYGAGWNHCKDSWRKSITYDGQQKVYNGSKIVLSVNNFNDVEMYFSARQLCAMATGTLTISAYIPGLEKYFKNGEEIVWFKSSDECIELVKYYLDHEDEAHRIGMNGSKIILENHTRIAKIKRLRKMLNI